MEFTSGEYQVEMCWEGSLQSATIHTYIHIQMFDYESRWITHQRLRRRLVVEWVNTYLQYAITTKEWGYRKQPNGALRVCGWFPIYNFSDILWLLSCTAAGQGVHLPASHAVAMTPWISLSSIWIWSPWLSTTMNKSTSSCKAWGIANSSQIGSRNHIQHLKYLQHMFANNDGYNLWEYLLLSTMVECETPNQIGAFWNRGIACPWKQHAWVHYSSWQRSTDNEMIKI